MALLAFVFCPALYNAGHVFLLDEPLFSASLEGDERAVRDLLRRGADPNFRWKGESTALDVALRERNLGVARLLVAAGGRATGRCDLLGPGEPDTPRRARGGPAARPQPPGRGDAPLTR